MNRRKILPLAAALGLLAAPALAQGAGGEGGDRDTLYKSGLNEEQVRWTLEQEGYTEIGELRLDGLKYETTAEKDGNAVRLYIDARSGTVVETGG